MESTECPPPAKRRRSDATRAAILAAARERFAAEGYERATIRSIAKDASINPSLVMRYYGSKEGLFAVASAIDLRLPDLTRLPVDEVGAALVSHFFGRWESDETLTALLRAGASNPMGAESMRQIFRTQVEPLVTAVCPLPEEASVRATLIASQILGAALLRYVLRYPAARDLSLDDLLAWLAPVVQHYLTAPAPSPVP